MTAGRRAIIEGLSYRGHGQARIDGRLVPVPAALPGETVEIVPFEGPRGRPRARLLRVLHAAPDRVDPHCDQADRCPGCALRHLAPARQRRVKGALQAAALARIAGRAVPPTPRVYAGSPADGYRGRAVAFVHDDVLGMRAHHGAPIDLSRCPVQSPATRALLAGALAEIGRLGLRPTLRHVVAEATDRGDERLLLGLTAAIDFDRLAATFLPDRRDLALLAEHVRPDDPRVGHAPRRLRGSATAALTVGGDRLRTTLPAWTPHAPLSLATVRARVLEALDLHATADVLEVGCGIGTLSLAVARRARWLVGVDWERSAVGDAAANARRAGVPNATFRVGRASKALRRLVAGGLRPSHALLHAMRRPFGPAAMSALRALAPERIVYLAPSPAALGRDLAALGPRYALETLSFVDQLPGTAHLLAICTLRRLGARVR